jgi:acetyl-CoA carboxylase carboxyltransferase component
VLARVVDGSEFDEFKPRTARAGDRLGRDPALPDRGAGNARGVLFSAEAQKAAQFIQLANVVGTPLLFLQNTTGYMVGSAVRAGAASSSTARS